MKKSLPVLVFLALTLAACGDSGNSSSPPPPAAVAAGAGPAGPLPSLGAASTFGVFASSSAAITLAADSVVNGDVGINPTGACNNCAVGTTVVGAIHNGDSIAALAQTDFAKAYIDVAARAKNACPISAALEAAQAACSGTTPGPSYPPGLYNTASGLDLGVDGVITLDAKGNSNAVWIFQAGTSLTTGAGSQVVLAGGARADNVFWAIGTAATLGVSSIFKGNVVANTAAITASGGTVALPSTIEGRLLSGGAAITVNAFTTVNVPK